MQTKRVGTLTLGVTLISLGIIYLLISIFNMNLYAVIIKCWPIFLVSLGLEVLYYNSKSTKENIPLKFDVLSFFLIIIMIFTSFAAFGVNKLVGELFDPTSPLFYKNHIHCNNLHSFINNITCFI